MPCQYSCRICRCRYGVAEPNPGTDTRSGWAYLRPGTAVALLALVAPAPPALLIAPTGHQAVDDRVETFCWQASGSRGTDRGRHREPRSKERSVSAISNGLAG